MSWKHFAVSRSDGGHGFVQITFVNAELNTGKRLFINGGGDPAFTVLQFLSHERWRSLGGLGNQNRNFNTNIEAVTSGSQRSDLSSGRRFRALPAN